MNDYHDLYLKCDVLLLEKFRNNSLKNYGLCTSHYLSAPALSWDALLNMRKVDLENISNADMYLFFQKVVRGEFSYIRRDIVKPIINIWNLMIQSENQNMLYT